MVDTEAIGGDITARACRHHEHRKPAYSSGWMNCVGCDESPNKLGKLGPCKARPVFAYTSGTIFYRRIFHPGLELFFASIIRAFTTTTTATNTSSFLTFCLYTFQFISHVRFPLYFLTAKYHMYFTSGVPQPLFGVSISPLVG